MAVGGAAHQLKGEAIYVEGRVSSTVKQLSATMIKLVYSLEVFN